MSHCATFKSIRNQGELKVCIESIVEALFIIWKISLIQIYGNPKDGSQLVWKSRNDSFESIFAKKKHFCQAQLNFRFSGHPERRNVLRE